MKNLLLCLFFLGATLTNAQITEDPVIFTETHGQPPTPFAYGDSAHAMQYGFATHNNLTYTFYSLPSYAIIGSLTIQPPNTPNLDDYRSYQPWLITQKLFDNDDGLEFMVNAENVFHLDSFQISPGQFVYIDSVVTEVVLYNLESNVPVQKFSDVFYNLSYRSPLYASSDSSYKMALVKYSTFNGINPKQYKYFSLPGYLQPKYGNPNVLNLYRSEYNINSSMLNAFPNPSAAGMITVNYDIPISEKAKLNLFDFHGRIMGSYDLDANSKAIQINTNNLAPGTYFYQVASPSSVSESKKLIVQ